MNALAHERYVLFTTFKKNGQPVSSPVWIAGLPEGNLGFTTEAGSWKVKRLKRNDAAALQPCNSRGKVLPGSEPTPATAYVAYPGSPDFAAVTEAIGGKYGFQFTAIRAGQELLRRIQRRPAEQCVVVVSTEEPAAG
ncbi:MAG: PPOX class F420-dependent enzyme [Micrococcales bacterium]|nr:MAG: PPOX class F420-dependent enzyme [Micrococcales bacterium]